MVTKSELKEIKSILADFGIVLTSKELEEMSQMTSVAAHNKKLEMIKNKLK